MGKKVLSFIYTPAILPKPNRNLYPTRQPLFNLANGNKMVNDSIIGSNLDSFEVKFNKENN
jgi:hypothetical protein